MDELHRMAEAAGAWVAQTPVVDRAASDAGNRDLLDDIATRDLEARFGSPHRPHGR
jgi:hypothetical protein